ncbi:MAG: glycosyltransferase [Chloroflexi bacterium]|nr:glycosyltransferase [Chloroflexota bacterium]
MSTPWLSVICPVFNGEKYLPFALESIVLQGDSDIECLAVDDGSTDATQTILNAYRKKIPLQVYHAKNGNWTASTNLALSLAKGEYACFLHQDDIWLKNRLVTLRDIAQKLPQIDLIVHPSIFISETGKRLGTWKCPLPSYPQITKSSILTERLLTQNFISIPGAIIKRKLILKVGGMDETLWYTADWDLWLKLSIHTDAVYYPIPLSGFRVHATSQTVQRSVNEEDFQRQMTVVAKKHVQLLNLPASRQRGIWRVAQFSIKVNTRLAMLIHGEKINCLELFISFVKLGPSGWRRYFRDSRILERAIARIKAKNLK